MARSAVHSEFFFLIDVDLTPSSNLRKEFNQFVTDKQLWDSHTDQDIFIVPAFELHEKESLPTDKLELLDLLKNDKIRAFHSRVSTNSLIMTHNDSL